MITTQINLISFSQEQKIQRKGQQKVKKYRNYEES